MLEWTSTGINKSLKTSLIIITHNKCLEVLLLSHRKWIILRFLRSIIQLSSQKVRISSIKDFPWTLPRLGIFSVSFLSVLLIDDKMRTQKKRSCSEVSISSRTWMCRRAKACLFQHAAGNSIHCTHFPYDAFLSAPASWMLIIFPAVIWPCQSFTQNFPKAPRIKFKFLHNSYFLFTELLRPHP